MERREFIKASAMVAGAMVAPKGALADSVLRAPLKALTKEQKAAIVARLRKIGYR